MHSSFATLRLRKAFTLLFIDWYAQGQLSIVQITGAVKSLAAGAGLKSFLYDPVSQLLIAFTPVSLVVCDRSSFCGWLCPFETPRRGK